MNENPDPLDALTDRLRAVGQAEGGPMFMGFPDRWWEAHTRRCVNDHISTMTLKSEELGRDACLAPGCMAPLCLTFPEDVDGPLYVTKSGKVLTDADIEALADEAEQGYALEDLEPHWKHGDYPDPWSGG